jgi:putative transposase
MQYRRVHVAGGTYFFTVNLADRSADTLVRHIDDLRDVLYKVKAAHPFSLIAMVVLPELYTPFGVYPMVIRITPCDGR